MTFDLGDDNFITFNAFRDKGWVTIQSSGGRLGVQMTPEQAEEFGLVMYCAARRLKRDLKMSKRRTCGPAL